MRFSESIKLKQNLTRIFLTRGREGTYTKTFDCLSPPERSALEVNYSFVEGEIPIIGAYKNQEEWLIITTMNISWCCSGLSFCVPITDIVFATVDLDGMLEKRLTMDKVDEILISTKGKKEFGLKMEAGGPMCGVWNALLYLSRLNTKNLKT